MELSPTWREQPVRSVVIASYKKNMDDRYRRQNRMDRNAAQRPRRDCFHDASWAEYDTQPRIPEGAVHLIVGDSLVRVLTRIQSHWKTGVLSFSGAATLQMLASLEMLGMARLNEKVRNLNEIIRQIHQRSGLPVRLLDVADQIERSFPEDASSDGIHFDRPRGVEWLNDVFQRHISALEAELLETAQVTFGPPPNPPFLATRPLSSRLGARVDSRDSSRSSRTRLPGSTPMETEEAESSTPQISVVSSVVVVDKKKVERPAETSRTRYLGESKGVGPGGSGVQTGVGGGPGAQARVNRGFEPTPLRGLVKGPRNAISESKIDGDA